MPVAQLLDYVGQVFDFLWTEVLCRDEKVNSCCSVLYCSTSWCSIVLYWGTGAHVRACVHVCCFDADDNSNIIVYCIVALVTMCV